MSAAKNAADPRKHPNVTVANVRSFPHPVSRPHASIRSSIFGAIAIASANLASFVTCEPAQTNAITSPAALNVAPSVAADSGGIPRSVHAAVKARV
jgi:hypothetical protein